MKLTEEQEKLVCEAGRLLKLAFPCENMQFCFNLSMKNDNVNYNAKKSGIINSKKRNLQSIK